MHKPFLKAIVLLIPVFLICLCFKDYARLILGVVVFRANLVLAIILIFGIHIRKKANQDLTWVQAYKSQINAYTEYKTVRINFCKENLPWYLSHNISTAIKKVSMGVFVGCIFSGSGLRFIGASCAAIYFFYKLVQHLSITYIMKKKGVKDNNIFKRESTKVPKPIVRSTQSKIKNSR